MVIVGWMLRFRRTTCCPAWLRLSVLPRLSAVRIALSSYRPRTLLVSKNGEQPKPDRDRDLAADLRLRPERPPVTRLSRRVLIGLAAIAAISVASALIVGLYQGQKKSTGGTELYNTENKPTPDGLTTLPRDYTGLPRASPPPIAPGVPLLGPPLPGDLGRPIHNAQVPALGSGEAAVDAEQQRVSQETESRAHKPPVRHYELKGAPDANRFAGADSHGPSRRKTDRARRTATVRSGLTPEHAGPQARIPDGCCRPQDREPRSACQPGIALCGSGRRRHSGGAHHRHSQIRVNSSGRQARGGGLFFRGLSPCVMLPD